MSDFINLGGGMTPRPREDPKIILDSRGAPKIKSSFKFKELIKKFDALGKLDLEDFKSTEEMCQFLDFYNDTVLKGKQNDYERELTARNEYYWKLWARAMEGSN